MPNAHQILASRATMERPLIIDGGMGTELKNRGAFPCLREYQQLWSAAALTHGPGRQTVVDAHVAFIEAGAELIITNTYACTPEILSKRGLENQLEDLISTGCRLADDARKKAGKPETLIAGSLPPISVTYRPDLSPDESVLEATYQRIAAALAPHVDLFICETMSSVHEAKTAASVARRFGKPVWVACTLSQPTKRDAVAKSRTRGTKRVTDATSMLNALECPNNHFDQLTVALRSGESIAEYCAAVDAVCDAILFNCSTPEATSVAIAEVRAVAPHKPCGAYANHFQPVPLDWVLDADEEGGGLLTVRGDLTPETYARYAAHWRSIGASIIGGCCGITPGHIAHLADTFRAEDAVESLAEKQECIFEVVSGSISPGNKMGSNTRLPLTPQNYIHVHA